MIDRYLTEKIPGKRVLWNCKNLVDNQGKIIENPSWFTEDFPDFEMEGIITEEDHNEKNDSKWRKTRFVLIDLPQSDLRFEDRLKTFFQRI